MKNKRCFLVTAYCNDSVKKRALKDTLTHLRKYNTDIILFSHYPIDEDVYDLTEYSIYDYSNPIFENNPNRSMVNWSKFAINGLPFKINTHSIDYGYAAAQQIKRGLLFASELSYDEVFIINYDLEVTDKMINEFSNSIKDHDSVLPIYGDDDDGLYMAWFALKLKPFIDNLKTISEYDYRDFIGGGIVEEYLYSKFKNENSKLIPRLEWEGPDPRNGFIKTSIVMEGNIMNRFSRDNFNWFTGHEIHQVDNNRVDSGKQILMLWNINEDLNVSIMVNDKMVSSSTIPKKLGYHIVYLPMSHEEFKNNINNIIIRINGWDVPRDLLILNKISSIEIAYNGYKEL